MKITKTQQEEFEELVAAYEAARAAIIEWTATLADEWSDAWSEKSERWQDSEAGQAADERITNLRAIGEELDTDLPSLDEVMSD